MASADPGAAAVAAKPARKLLANLLRLLIRLGRDDVMPFNQPPLRIVAPPGLAIARRQAPPVSRNPDRGAPLQTGQRTSGVLVDH